MSEDPKAAGRPRLGFLTWALWGAALIGAAAVVYIIAQSSTKTAPVTASLPPTKTLAQKLTRPEQPTPAPDYTFYDEAGKAVKVADFKGKVVVLNVWATWCAPCKVEMPTLAKLAADYRGKDVVVAPVSIDSESAVAQARIFIASHEPLKFFHDREMKIPFKINAQGAPTTVIYGRDGLERARVSGEADWSGKEAHALIDEALAG